MAANFIQRLLGIISMVVLARILTPEDFGMVAIVTLAVFFFETLTNLGAKQYISQAKHVDEEVVNSAWTLNIIIKLFCWLLLVFSAESIALFLEKPEMVNALYALSLILPVTCFSNPGMLLFIRDLNYGPQFKIMVSTKFISFCFVITYAVWQQTYWAMIWGSVISYFLPAIFSHFMTNHKQRLTLQNAKKQLSFSKWIIMNGVLGYSKSQTDSFVVSKFFSLETIGIYGMFKNLAMMPISLVIDPATEPLLASFSKSKRAGEILPYQINLAILVSFLFVCPLVTLFILFHHDVILLVLGEKWVENSIVLAALSPMLLSYTLVRVVSQLVIAKGKLSSLFYFDLVIFFFVTIILVYMSDDTVLNFSLTRSFLAMLSAFMFILFIVRKHMKIGVSTLILFMLPFTCSIISAILIMQIMAFIPEFNLFLNLAIGSLLFAALYLLFLVLTFYPVRNKYEVKIVHTILTKLLSKISSIKATLRKNKVDGFKSV